jgi:predicted HD phosphohydrolase
MMTLLGKQRGNTLGYRVDRYTHSLQTGTRAYRNGADDETVVTALFHDVGDGMGVFNHSQVAAALLRPFISERNYWVVRHHGLFQGYFYFHYVGRDRDERDRYRGNPYYQACVDFCEQWDGPSFDPDYDTMPLDAFKPIIERVFARRPRMFD